MLSETIRRQAMCDHCRCFVTITYVNGAIKCPICHKPPLVDELEPTQGFNGMFSKKPKRQWIAPVKPP